MRMSASSWIRSGNWSTSGLPCRPRWIARGRSDPSKRNWPAHPHSKADGPLASQARDGDRSRAANWFATLGDGIADRCDPPARSGARLIFDHGPIAIRVGQIPGFLTTVLLTSVNRCGISGSPRPARGRCRARPPYGRHQERRSARPPATPCEGPRHSPKALRHRSGHARWRPECL
jgi:hypothetical protein